MPNPAPRAALARPVAFACVIAGLCAFGNHAMADQRRSDDGGRLVAVAERFLGMGNVTGHPGPWCGFFASMVLTRTGHRPLASGMAYSALSYGPHVRNPRPGDLIVLRGASHVGIFAGWDRGRPVMVSGNWGKRVSRAVISLGSVAAFVRPT